MAIARPLMNDKTDPTHITYKWGQNIIDYALSHGVDVLDIKDPWVDYQNITGILANNHPELFVYTGHGCRNYLSTQNGCSLTNGFQEDVCTNQCSKPENLNVLKDSIVVTFSCHSSSQLGKCAVKHGARAYVGFSDYLMFTVDSVGSQDLFRDALLPMVTELIDGKTVSDAVATTKSALITAAKQWKPVKYLSIPMYWNYEYMQVIGDLNAKLGG